MAMIDTVAASNIIDELKYQSLCNKPEIVRLDKPFYGFGNLKKPLVIMGHNSMEGERQKSLLHRYNIAVALGMVT